MNKVVIEPTQFINVRGPEGENVTWGYRIYDNYGSHYDNTLESIPDDDLELLKIVVENNDDVIQDMLGHLVETENGLEIGGAWYDYSEIKQIIG
jgi:hypothetical protein